MASPSKAKGNRFERELVNKAKEYGLEAKRAYASNGLSLGLTDDVDLLIDGKAYQAKCRKTIGELYKPNKNVFGQIFKEDRGDTYVMVRLDDYLKLLNKINALKDDLYIANLEPLEEVVMEGEENE